MNRFEAASDGELQSFADNQKSLNTQRSTKTTMCLLEQYKVEAFNYTNGFETMDRNNLVKLLKSFYQKIKKSDGEPYEPGSLRTMHYYDECCYCYDRKQYSIVIRKELYVIIFKVIIKI